MYKEMAGKGKPFVTRGTGGTPLRSPDWHFEGYQRLLGAVVKQAVKDKAEGFLKSNLCKRYCQMAGIELRRAGSPVNL